MSFEKNIQNPNILMYADYKKDGHIIAPPEAEKLIDACEDGKIFQVHKLIKADLNPNFVLNGEYYFSPLLQAITANQWNVVNYLLHFPNIEVNIYGHYKFGATPLLLAIEEKSTPLKIINQLLKKGADVNHRADDGVYIYTPHYQTALIICSIEGYYKKTKLLLNSGADPNLTSTYNYSPLMYASGNNHADITKLLLDTGSNPNHRANDGMTALLLAGQNQNKTIINLLQKFGAKII